MRMNSIEFEKSGSGHGLTIQGFAAKGKEFAFKVFRVLPEEVLHTERMKGSWHKRVFALLDGGRANLQRKRGHP